MLEDKIKVRQRRKDRGVRGCRKGCQKRTIGLGASKLHRLETAHRCVDNLKGYRKTKRSVREIVSHD